MVPYADAVVAVTVMHVLLFVLHVLLFVLHVCLLRECDGAGLTAMLVWGIGVVSAGHVGGTHGSADVLWMSVVREMCMSLAPRGGLVDERIGFGLYQSCGEKGSVGHVSVFYNNNNNIYLKSNIQCI